MVEVKKIENSQVEISISVYWDEWKKHIDKAYESFAREVKVDGFREGKVPKDMIEKKVGKSAILEEAANQAIQKTYPEALEKEKIEAIGAPKAEIIKLEEGEDLEYKIVTAVMPEVSLKDYKDKIKEINKKHSNNDEISVSEDDIKGELDRIAQSRVKLVTVNREAKEGDSVVLDFEVKRDGIPIEGGTSKKHPMVLGKGVFIPGFEEKVIGMKAGEEKEFELKFPENYHEKSLAGKPATFWVKVEVVQDRQTPEINDDFAKSLGKFEKLEELRKSVRGGLEEEKKKKKKEETRAEYVQTLIDAASAEVPDILLEEEIKRMFSEFEAQLSGMGMDLDKYLAQVKKTKEEVEKEWKPQAEKRILASLALGQVIKDEDIEVPAEKVEEEMNKTLSYYKGIQDAEKNIDLGQLYNYVKGNLQNEEVFKTLEKLGS